MSAERAVTVLAVDDDARSRRATLRLLRQAGFRTRQAATGDQALSVVTKQRPDLIVLNDDVEGGRGPELSRQIKRLPEGAQTPVLHLASTQAPPGTLPEGIDIGVDGCLSQPADPAALLTTVNVLLRARRLEQSAAAERAMWQAALEAARVAVSFVDLEGRILNCNTAFLAIINRSREEVTGHTFREILPEPAASATRALLECLRVSSRPQATELCLEDRWCATMLDPLLDAAGNLVGGVYSCLDITERKAMQEELAHACDEAERRAREAEESKGILDAIMEHLPLAMLIVDAPDASVRMVSKYGLETAGHTAETMLGISAEELAEVLPIYQPDGVTPVPAEEMHIVRAARYGEAAAAQQWVVVRPDGKKMAVLSTAGPICDRDGNLIGGVVVWQDITPLRQLEAERERLLADIEEQRRFLEAVVNNAPGGIVVLDEQARVIISNPTAEAIMVRPAPVGREYENLSELHLLRPDGTPFPPREMPPVRAALDGESFVGEEATVVRPDGTRRNLLGNMRPIRGDEGELRGAIIVFQDITEQKQTQQELERLLEVERARVQEARLLEAVLENTPSAIAYVDREARYTFVNPAYVRASGRRVEDILGRRALDFFPQPEYQAMYFRARDTGEPVSGREMPLALPARPEAGLTYWDFTLTPIKNDAEEVEGVLLTAIEVTDKVRARERIAAAERAHAREARLLSTILESMPGLVAYVDRELRYQRACSIYASGLGLTRDEIVGKSHAELFAHAPQTTEWLAKARDVGDKLEMREIRSVTPLPGAEPGEAWLDVTHTPVKDEKGEVEGVVVFLIDVTAKVKQRETLLETERARCQLAETLNEEINHRVKNNLMMVVGLLQMQMVQETDPRVADALHDAMTRLLIFASIHDQLRFGPAEEIDLLEDVRRIADVTRSAFTGAQVDLTVSGDPAPCPAPPATPILIIVNELLTNAIRHGAPEPDGRQRVACSLSAADGTLRISVWSSGNPLPEDFDPGAQTTLGLRLVWDVVVTRYQGTFTLRPDRGGNLAEIALDYQRLRQDL
jgi:PAS domain S-box-containing protein